MATNTTSGSDARTLRVRPIDDVPPDRPVWHFDELPERAQQLFAERDDRGCVAVAPDLASAFADEPVVVFSEYLLIESA